jgi:hypothetical protein
MKLNVIECGGHPRDMGGMQGRTCQRWVRECVSQAGLAGKRGRWPSLSAFTAGPVRGHGPGREIVRHYTHLSERMDGLAREAGVPTDAIFELHLRAASGRSGSLLQPVSTLAAVDLDGQPGISLARGLPVRGGRDGGWIVRRSLPEVGFASLEVTLPWLVTAVAGVNVCGLVVCFAPGAADEAVRSEAPPFVLLVQECLQRFETVAGAAEWCASRSAAGPGAIVVADAAGSRARIESSGEQRRIHLDEELPLALGGPPRLTDTLAETARHERRLDEKALCVDGGCKPPGAFVRLTSSDRALQLKSLAPPVQEAVLRI